MTNEQLIRKAWQIARDWELCAEQYEPIKNEMLQRMAESSLARKQEREANCKAMCCYCRNEAGIRLPAEFIEGEWQHRSKSRPNMTIACLAAAIHERGRKVEG